MSKMKILPLILLLWNHLLPAQVDSTTSADSLEPPERREEEIDQNLDDSPILDLLGVDRGAGISGIEVSVRSRLSMVLERSKGFERGDFIGSPFKSFQRVELHGGRFGGGLVLAKDPGEPRVDDFESGYVRLTNIGPLGRIVLGDYFIEGGQGVALWRGFDYGKGTGVVSAIKRSGRGIVPYRSANENAFLRGAAAEFNLGSASIILFYSRRSLSASRDTAGSVSSFYTSGIYRTDAQASLRDAVGEHLAGFRGSVRFGGVGNAGITYYGARFSERLHLSAAGQISGDRYSIAAVDYHLNILPAMLTGEWAVVAGEAGGVSALFLNPSTRLVLVASFRHYPERFASLHGLGFGEHSSTSNEDGLYLGTRLRLADGILLSSYYDQFRFPGGSAGVPYPTGGHESLVQLRLHVGGRCDIQIVYDRKTAEAGERGTPDGGLERTLTNVRTLQRFRSHVEYDISDEVRLRARLEKVLFRSELDGKLEQGTMLYEDVAFQPAKPLSANLRLILFRTDSFAARITELEDDLAGLLTAPALSGQGARWYLLVKLRLGGDCTLSAKYSRLIRDDVRHLGSGLDQLPASEEDRFGAQLDIKF